MYETAEIRLVSTPTFELLILFRLFNFSTSCQKSLTARVFSISYPWKIILLIVKTRLILTWLSASTIFRHIERDSSSATQPRKVLSNTDRSFQIVECCDVIKERWPASNTIVHQRLGMEYYNSDQIVKSLWCGITR